MPTPIRLCAVAVTVPFLVLLALLLVPGLNDLEAPGPTFHFYVVSAASLLAAAVSVVLIISARSVRDTRILFLALCFFSLGMIFAIHGLTTPGELYEAPTAALQRSPWLSTLAASLCAMLSVIAIPRFVERSRFKLPEATFAVAAFLICVYFVVSLASPDWAEGFPTQEAWFRHLLTAVTIGLLSFAALRYYQSYLFARLPSQLAVGVGLVLLAEAQVSLNFGEVWYYGWWMYHFLFLASFATVLAGWTRELLRARSAGAISEAIAMRDALTQLNRGRTADLVTLADQIESHDLETFRHVDRVAAFSYAIGRDLGFGPGRLRQLVLAAQMHDIGKIGLPPYILKKPGKLTEDEFSLMRLHPGKGHEIVGRLPGLEPLANIIRHHHERFDGTGYPDKKAGGHIPLEARIISVADTFDALTSQRPYREMLSVERAKDELQRVAGSQLDPSCVAVLVKLLENGTLATRKPGAVPTPTN